MCKKVDYYCAKCPAVMQDGVGSEECAFDVTDECGKKNKKLH